MRHYSTVCASMHTHIYVLLCKSLRSCTDSTILCVRLAQVAGLPAEKRRTPLPNRAMVDRDLDKLLILDVVRGLASRGLPPAIDDTTADKVPRLSARQVAEATAYVNFDANVKIAIDEANIAAAKAARAAARAAAAAPPLSAVSSTAAAAAVASSSSSSSSSDAATTAAANPSERLPNESTQEHEARVRRLALAAVQQRKLNAAAAAAAAAASAAATRSATVDTGGAAPKAVVAQSKHVRESRGSGQQKQRTVNGDSSEQAAVVAAAAGAAADDTDAAAAEHAGGEVEVAVRPKRKRAAVAATTDAATATAAAGTESRSEREGQQVQFCEAAGATETNSKRCRVIAALTEQANGGASLAAVAQESRLAVDSVLQRSVENVLAPPAADAVQALQEANALAAAAAATAAAATAAATAAAKQLVREREPLEPGEIAAAEPSCKRRRLTDEQDSTAPLAAAAQRDASDSAAVVPAVVPAAAAAGAVVAVAPAAEVVVPAPVQPVAVAAEGVAAVAQDWRAAAHEPLRSNVAARIKQYLQLRMAAWAPRDQRERELLEMALPLEDKLYRAAASLALYNDWSTLDARLQPLAAALISSRGNAVAAPPASAAAGSKARPVQAWQHSVDIAVRQRCLQELLVRLRRGGCPRVSGPYYHHYVPQLAVTVEHRVFSCAVNALAYESAFTAKQGLTAMLRELLQQLTAALSGVAKKLPVEQLPPWVPAQWAQPLIGSPLQVQEPVQQQQQLQQQQEQQEQQQQEHDEAGSR
jgi:hypothetical protein